MLRVSRKLVDPDAVKAWLSQSHSRPRIAAVALTLVLLSLPFVVRLDGKPHADWQQLLGRFHPLAVHLPIGLIVLVPLLEIGSKLRPALREAVDFVLALALVSCLGSLTLGYLLAYGSGASGPTVTAHLWGAIVLSIGAMLCLFVRPAWIAASAFSAENGQISLAKALYPSLLAGVVLTLAWTAHQGGSLTHGANYLTQYMSPGMQRWLDFDSHLASTKDAGSFYARHINPVLDTNCVSCHGESKSSGGLRLDSYEQLMKGGKDGAVIVAGHPETSLLIERITLPTSHKLFMPAEGRPPLQSEEIAWLKSWITQGASASATKLAGVAIREDSTESMDPPPQPVADYSALLPEISQLAQGQGAKLLPVSSNPSDGLILSTTDVSPTFNDAQLAQFQKFAPYIVEAELGRTAVTDAGFDTLGKFTHLRKLHLEGTAVAGGNIAKLASLADLRYVNLSGSRVTPAAAAALDSMKSVRHVYLFNTPAQPATTAAAQQDTAPDDAQDKTRKAE